jgi:hypothetical protein
MKCGPSFRICKAGLFAPDSVLSERWKSLRLKTLIMLYFL